MKSTEADELPETSLHLWLLAAPPAIWTAHLLLCYVTAAIWCARVAGPDGALGVVRTLILVYTATALVGITVIGWDGYRRHRHGGTETVPHDFDSAEDRHRFLGFATLLLAGLSAVATVYVAIAALFFESCR
jgi:hypothetical protein